MTAALGEIVLGWLLADFLSGIVHWMQDRVIPPRWRVVGPALAQVARLHHRKPTAFLTNGWPRRNGLAIAASVSIGAGLAFAFGPALWIASATIGGMLAAQAHYWTHAPLRAPRLARIAQEMGVLQAPRHHAPHHRPPHLQRYCALSNFLNPMLDRVRFWHRLEKICRIKDAPL